MPRYIRLATNLDQWDMHKVRDAVRSSHGQDGAIVLDVQQGRMFNLNLVGSRILELMKDGSTQSEIVDVISGEFHTPRALVEADVTDFIDALKGYRLVDGCPPDGAI